MATPAKSVQAKDADSVVAFYTNRDVPSFSVRQGNQLIYAYEGESISEGADLLADFVDNFVIRPRSAAIYTLCVHSDPKGPISNKTDYNGSINFRMFDYGDMYGGNDNRNAQQSALPPALESKINGITTELAQLKKQMGEGPKPEESKLGMIGEILDHPLGFAIGQALIEKFLPGARVPTPAAINGTDLEDAQNQLNDALIVLIQSDPEIPVYLYKLSVIAKSDPPRFKNMIGMLKMVL